MFDTGLEYSMSNLVIVLFLLFSECSIQDTRFMQRVLYLNRYCVSNYFLVFARCWFSNLFSYLSTQSCRGNGLTQLIKRLCLKRHL